MDIEKFKEEHLRKVQEWKKEAPYESGRLLWYKRYNDMLRAVKKIKSELENDGKLEISNPDHKNFLDRLLLQNDNGISNAGFGSISQENYQVLIHDNEVLKAIEAVIMNPTVKNGEQIAKALYCGRNHWLIACRVIAACTDKVSSTVHLSKFLSVFEWFIDEKIILPFSGEYSSSKIKIWHDTNEHLMNELYKIFADEMKNGSTDKVFISMYVWEMWVQKSFEKSSIKSDETDEIASDEAYEEFIGFAGTMSEADYIKELIDGGESDIVEFKSKVGFDSSNNNKKSIGQNIMIVVSAFMNTDGGTLLIGIGDKKEIIGIEEDLSNLKKKNPIDDFYLRTAKMFNNFIGNEHIYYINFKIHDIDDKLICVVKVKPLVDRTVAVKLRGDEKDKQQKEDALYVRSGPSCEPLTHAQQSIYEEFKRSGKREKTEEFLENL